MIGIRTKIELDYEQIRAWVDTHFGTQYKIRVSDDAGYMSGESKFIVRDIQAEPAILDMAEDWQEQIADQELGIWHTLCAMVLSGDLPEGLYDVYHSW